MKLKKIIISIIVVGIIIISSSSNVFALYAYATTPTYNPVSLLISNVMRIATIPVIIMYFIFCIVYLYKKKKDKDIKKKIKTIIISGLIVAIIVIVLIYTAPIVKRIGVKYKYSPGPSQSLNRWLNRNR